MSSRPARAVKGWPGPLSSRNRPNSFVEWIVGCNLPSPFNVPGQGAAPEFALTAAHDPRLQPTPESASLSTPALPRAQARPAAQETVPAATMASPSEKDLRLQLEVYADNLYQTDTMAITLPRPGSSHVHRPALNGNRQPNAFDKNVTFCAGLKSALKTPRATIIELSTDSSSSSVSEEESSSSDESASSDAAWSDDDDISDLFYRFNDSDAFTREKRDRASSSPEDRGRNAQQCLPVPVPVYYPVGIEPGQRQAYGPEIPWKPREAPIRDHSITGNWSILPAGSRQTGSGTPGATATATITVYRSHRLSTIGRWNILTDGVHRHRNRTLSAVATSIVIMRHFLQLAHPGAHQTAQYPVPGAWFDPPEAEHKLREDYKRHRMEVYKREQERVEQERARLHRRQNQDPCRPQERVRESSPPPVWGDATAAQSRHTVSADVARQDNNKDNKNDVSWSRTEFGNAAGESREYC
ncbi:hypothetical protein F503_06702 [Ophiostoma piceae UAMH 11346]|uniref:Uncharacterized protein n=1 Tax=Ophiostoma piceae (strain UAMH 11346) TaxID=1262450 RepID=S3BQC0_OPHP1|nr:hypothetical protein F503_06702 [Ophiostoma piceae UAMH 11346]